MDVRHFGASRRIFVVIVAALLLATLLGASSAGAQSPPASAVSFGHELAALARAGDVAGISALAVTSTYTCPVDPVYRAPICDGKPDGTVAEGHPIGGFQSEGTVVDLATMQEFIRQTIDSLASGDIRLYTVTQAGDRVVLSTPVDAANTTGALVLTFGVRATPDGFRITDTVNGFALGGDPSAALVEGGAYNDSVYIRVDLFPPATGSGELAGSSHAPILLLAGALALLAGMLAAGRSRMRTRETHETK